MNIVYSEQFRVDDDNIISNNKFVAYAPYKSLNIWAKKGQRNKGFQFNKSNLFTSHRVLQFNP